MARCKAFSIGDVPIDFASEIVDIAERDVVDYLLGSRFTLTTASDFKVGYGLRKTGDVDAMLAPFVIAMRKRMAQSPPLPPPEVLKFTDGGFYSERTVHIGIAAERFPPDLHVLRQAKTFSKETRMRLRPYFFPEILEAIGYLR